MKIELANSRPNSASGRTAGRLSDGNAGRKK
jgi:hypothetical protein